MEYKYRTTFSYQGKRYEVRANTVDELYEKKAAKKKQVTESVIVFDSHTSVDAWAEEAFDTYKSNVKGLYDIKNVSLSQTSGPLSARTSSMRVPGCHILIS